MDFDNVDDACAAFENASYALRGLSDETVIAAANAKKLTAEQLTMLLSIKGLTPAQVAEQLALNGLNKERVKAIMLSQNYTKEQVEAALATDAFAKATTKASFGAGKLGTAFSALAAKIGISTTALGGFIAVITAAVAIFALWKTHSEQTAQHLLDCANAATASVAAWRESNDSLNLQITRLGLSNFVTDMLTSGLMEQAGDRVELVAGTTIQEICEKLTITPEMAKSIFNALEMYEGWEFDWTDADFKIDVDASKIKALKEEIASLEAAIEGVENHTIELKPGESLEAMKQELQAKTDEYNKMLSSAPGNGDDNEIGYQIKVDSEEAEAALEAIKVKLDEISEKLKKGINMMPFII